MLVLYVVLVGVGILSLLAVARARWGLYEPGNLGTVSEQWRADLQARAGTD